jgi:hypothetical protein
LVIFPPRFEVIFPLEISVYKTRNVREHARKDLPGPAFLRNSLLPAWKATSRSGRRRGATHCAVVQAVPADPEQVELDILHAVALRRSLLQGRAGCGDIENPLAFPAEQMIMGVSSRIVAGLVPAYGQLTDLSRFSEKIEGAVNGGLRDGRIDFPELTIDLGGRGMALTVLVQKTNHRQTLMGQNNSHTA